MGNENIESKLIKYEDVAPELPKLAIANNIERCIRCANVWHDIDGDPDSNHCPPMIETAGSYKNLEGTPLMEVLKRIVRNPNVVCPFYDPENPRELKE